MRWRLAAVSFAAGVMFVPSAWAQTAPPTPTNPPEDGFFEVGVGLLGGVGMVQASAPNPDVLVLPNSGGTLEQDSWSGLHGQVGGFFEIRFARVFGVAVETSYTRAQLTSKNDLNGQDVKVTVTESDVHVPILLKGLWPLAPLTPFLALGPEVVLTGTPRTSSKPAARLVTAADSDHYLLLTAALGAELAAPVADVDLRATLSVRGSYAPGFDDAASERLRVLPSDVVVYENATRLRVATLVGLGAYF